MTILEFVGEPLDLAAPEPVRASGNPLRELRQAVAEAHISALRAQTALQLLTLGRRSAPRPSVTAAAEEGAFKPLARTDVTELDNAQLARLAAGDIAGVFGPAYDQQGANPDIRLPHQALTSAKLDRQCVTASYQGAYADAVAEAAQLFALYLGLHLCFADATLVTEGRIEGGGELALEFAAADLVPRPWVSLRAGAQEITVTVREKPGTPIGPERGGTVPWLGRKGALLSEFHMAHLARGDQGIAMGPEFAHYTGRKATRLPTGGLLLVDRVLDIRGERGKLDHASYETEYDSPADSWYYQDTANESMPNFVYMETSLQAALLIGYYLGPTLSTPDRTMSLRNLGGTATVLREVDLRDKTIHQSSELLSTTLLPGSSLQNFAYTLSTDGEPFYRGETMFGYFSDEALANQTGLDAGKSVPTWLDENPSATRRLDIEPSGKLTLLDHVDVVDGGGKYGQGYLHSVRRIDPADWFFARHFHLDPVIPGSLGVESVLQAMQAWLLDAGHDLHDAGFVVPVGDPFTWKYRGQFLPTDGECVLEAHIKEVRRGPGRVRVTADASLWKPGLRIYELIDAAIELRERGAQPW
ncbi:beta-ketoacyl synthase [Amycolatopsis acidicola]|uniref:Beta-ketoacyl synthase n=1 Tax=Amycolatopsis acidicola TaxID=2596893 RepID=A0A5N0UR41_9PSEU|nr:beta-ketoacyl synthase [Amycolatopsis acidicola]KAA9151256.1 beta-ketoacyl synthase [Amycolatopsis acidicola]